MERQSRDIRDVRHDRSVADRRSCLVSAEKALILGSLSFSRYRSQSGQIEREIPSSEVPIESPDLNLSSDLGTIN